MVEVNLYLKNPEKPLVKKDQIILKFIGTLLALAFAILSFQLGYFLTYGKSGREPAGMERDFDFSHLDDQEQTLAVRSRIISGINLVGSGLHYGVELGGYYSRNQKNEILKTCEQFDIVELEFIGSDMAISGESPSLTIAGPCRGVEYQNKIAPLYIPFNTLINKPARDLRMVADENGAPSIAVKNLSDSWPKVWILNNIRLHNKETLEKIVITKDEIKNIRGKHLVIELP